MKQEQYEAFQKEIIDKLVRVGNMADSRGDKIMPALMAQLEAETPRIREFFVSNGQDLESLDAFFSDVTQRVLDFLPR